MLESEDESHQEDDALIRTEVGAQIRRRRQEHGMSLRRLATELGVSPATVSAMENGKVEITSVRLTKVSSILKSQPSELLPGSSSPMAGRAVRSPQAFRGPIEFEPNPDWRSFGALDCDPILLAALKLFVDSGFHGATMREIAAASGMSVAGVYHHYPSKIDVLAALLDITMADLLSRSAAARDEGSSPVERFSLIVECLALFHTHRHDLGFIGASETRSMTGEYRDRFVQARIIQQEMVNTEISAAIDDGDFHVSSAEGAGRAVTMLCSALCQWYRESSPVTPQHIAQEYVGYALGLVGHRPVD